MCCIQVFLYNIKCLPLRLPVEKIVTLLTVLLNLFNDFLKTNTDSHSDKFHIIPYDIKFFYISLFQKIVKKNSE